MIRLPVAPALIVSEQQVATASAHSVLIQNGHASFLDEMSMRGDFPMRKHRQELSPDQADQINHLVASCLARSGFSVATPDQLEHLDQGIVGLTVTITAPGAGPVPPVYLTGKLLEMHHSLAPEEDTISCGGMVLDCRRRQVIINGTPLVLTPRELQLLTYLMRNPDTVLTRGQLLGSVWELSYAGDIRTVDTHVKCLRRKLGPYGRHIVTVRKVGYRFDSAVD